MNTTTNTTIMNEELPLLKMLQISDSMFPIGAFTLSDGLETFVSDKRLNTIDDLAEYVDSFITVLTYNDLAGVLKAYQICEKHCKSSECFEKELVQLDNLLFVLKSPSEVREGSRKLCSRFIKLWNDLSEYESLNKYSQLIAKKLAYGVHAVSVGSYAYDIGLGARVAASIYAYQKLSAVVTNAVKTVPLSQIKGQAVLSSALKRIPEAVDLAMDIKEDELGFGGSMFDIESMRHEQMYSRLYMS